MHQNQFSFYHWFINQNSEQENAPNDIDLSHNYNMSDKNVFYDFICL